MVTQHLIRSGGLMAAGALIGTVLGGSAFAQNPPQKQWQPRPIDAQAVLAHSAGILAMVSSALEIGLVRRVLGPGGWIVVPGIRPAGFDAGDQRRTAEPRAAALAGATHLVVGRPITRAKEPAAVYNQIVEELQECS